MGDGLYTASRDAHRLTDLSMPVATPQSVAEISAAWLEEVLRAAGAIAGEHVAAVSLRPIGESQGFLSSMAAVDLTYEGAAAAGSATGPPASVVVKLEPAAGVFRDAERDYNAFEREAMFYRNVAGQVDVRVPRVFHAHAGEDGSVLVMEDLSRLRAGDQVRGMQHEEVIATVRQIGRVHAAFWNNERLSALGWLPDHDAFWYAGYEERWSGFAQEYGVRLGAKGWRSAKACSRISIGSSNGSPGGRPRSFMPTCGRTICCLVSRHRSTPW